MRDVSIIAIAEARWPHSFGASACALGCFETYTAVEDVEPATIKNRVGKLRRHGLPGIAVGHEGRNIRAEFAVAAGGARCGVSANER